MEPKVWLCNFPDHTEQPCIGCKELEKKFIELKKHIRDLEKSHKDKEHKRHEMYMDLVRRYQKRLSELELKMLNWKEK